jgi:hypothetical protein
VVEEQASYQHYVAHIDLEVVVRSLPVAVVVVELGHFDDQIDLLLHLDLILVVEAILLEEADIRGLPSEVIDSFFQKLFP